jgi:hypothetical protein
MERRAYDPPERAWRYRTSFPAASPVSPRHSSSLLEAGLGSGRVTAYPEVIPKKCGSVRIGDYPGLIHLWSSDTCKITHRIQLPKAIKVPTGQIMTVSGKPNGDPACDAASRKVL